jgi:hypothetical protein
VTERESRLQNLKAAPTTTRQVDTADAISSRQVSWWTVHEHVWAKLADVDSWPAIGTPEWCALDDDDPRKRAAVYDAAQHWALRLETSQQAMAGASHDISAAVDWSVIAQHIRDEREFYAAHPWLKRGA